MSNNPPDDTKPLSKREEERLLKAGRSVFSNSFPNPTREGCPNREVIEAIVRGKGDPAQQRDFFVHMSRCSPCFNDFSAFRKAAQREKRRKALAIAAIIIVVCVASWFVVKSRRHTAGTYTAVVLDLRNRLVLRGVPKTGEPTQEPLMLLRGVDTVSLYLPSGSRTGTYDVGIFEEPGTPLASAAGTATLEGNLTVLKAKLDLATLHSGHYLLGIRLPGIDWNYYPLVLRNSDHLWPVWIEKLHSVSRSFINVSVRHNSNDKLFYAI
ncbi:MAG TPA: hypothetical protein VFZ08_11985 [Terriglobia bacterium]|nr:hypothetical protein [Terriglobia bacterium]